MVVVGGGGERGEGVGWPWNSSQHSKLSTPGYLTNLLLLMFLLKAWRVGRLPSQPELNSSRALVFPVSMQEEK